jgi:hypothetical protein
MFKVNIGAEKFLWQESVTLSEFNVNWNVPIGFSNAIVLQYSWKSNRTLSNANRRKDLVKFTAAQLYLFTECIPQHRAEKCASFKGDNPECNFVWFCM